MVSGDVDVLLKEASARLSDYVVTSRRILTVLSLGLAGLGGAIALSRIRPDFRARNRVEKIVLVVAHCGIEYRDFHDSRHRAVGTFRSDSIFSGGSDIGFPVRIELEPANGNSGRSGWLIR